MSARRSKFYKRVFGYGNYHGSRIGGGSAHATQSLGLFTNAKTTQPGVVFGNAGRMTTMYRREYIEDIVGSDELVVREYPLNPGMRPPFKWTSYLARLFEQWEPISLVFQFVSTSSNALSSSNTALGNVTISTEYNPASLAPQNISELMNMVWSTSQKPSVSFSHAIECARKDRATKLFFVRTGPNPNNQDIRFSDLGKVFVSTNGMQGAYTIGQLWVSYAIKFHKPQEPREIPSGGNGAGYSADPAPGYPLGITGNGTVVFNTINASFYPGDGVVAFPSNLSGTYQISMTFRGATVGSTSYTTLGYTGSLGTDVVTFNSIIGTALGTAPITGAAQTFTQTIYVTLDSTIPIEKAVYFSINSTTAANYSGMFMLIDQVPEQVSDFLGV